MMAGTCAFIPSPTKENRPCGHSFQCLAATCKTSAWIHSAGITPGPQLTPSGRNQM